MALSTAARNAAANAITALLNGGGRLQLATDGTFATILAEFNLATTAFNAANVGVAAIPAALTATATATGAAEAYRFINSASAPVITESDASAISGTGGGGQLVLAQANTAITSGQTITINTFTLTMPA
jgi:hypothetical protein